jgi:hypothetical protein
MQSTGEMGPQRGGLAEISDLLPKGAIELLRGAGFMRIFRRASPPMINGPEDGPP